jgi:hypothetical protein
VGGDRFVPRRSRGRSCQARPGGARVDRPRPTDSGTSFTTTFNVAEGGSSVEAFGQQELAVPGRVRMNSGSQAEAIDPSVTSPLCAAKAPKTSSFSR